MGYLVAGIAMNAETKNSRDVDYLRGAFGPVSFLYLHRSNVVAQAVSWARAEQSKVWHRIRPNDPVAQHDAKYSFEAIDGLVRTIGDHNRAWSDWFTANAVSPICIRYEDLEVDPEAVARGILRELKIDVPDGTDIKSPNIKLADKTSQEWIAKYAADRRG